MLLTLYTLVVVLLLFGLTIFVHELGHFLVARWCGLKVETFSIGFGSAIWKREIGGVVYKIGWLPLGGYVALPQMDPTGGNPDAEHKDGRDARHLPPVAPWKKLLVSVAGVTGNMILAYILAVIVFRGGQSFAPEPNTIVGFAATNSAAYEAGIRVGDTVEAIGDRRLSSWEDLVVTASLQRQADLSVRKPDGSALQVSLETEEFMGGRYIPGLLPMNHCFVLRVRPGSSAAEAGVQGGDKLLEFAGQRLYSREHLMQLVNERRDAESELVVEREGKRVALGVTPKFDEAAGRALIGVEFNTLDVKKPLAQLKSHAMLIFRILGALVTPSEAKAASQGIGGPVAILTMFWWSVQTSFILALWLTVMVNVNLAIINMLPLPVLDGGHIIFTLWEMIFRKPVSPRFVNFVWNAFAALLLTLFLVLTYRDVARLLPGGKKAAPAAEATDEAPPDPAEAAP